jgi:hypothetical protein
VLAGLADASDIAKILLSPATYYMPLRATIIPIRLVMHQAQ